MPIVIRRMVELPQLSRARSRKRGLGGSDIPAILGLTNYRSPMRVYAEKRGLVEPDEAGERAYWGTQLEDDIAARYTKEHRAKLVKPGLLRHDNEPWMLGTPDRFVLRNKKPTRGLELKTAATDQAYRWGPPGTDQIPEEYLIQCVWYMAVTGLRSWDVAVLIGGNEYREYHLARDAKLERDVVAKARAFWKRVKAGDPPEPDGTDATKRLLSKQFPRDKKPILGNTPEAEAWAVTLREGRAKLSDIKGEVLSAENHLKQLIGDAAGIEGPWGIITWRATKDRSVVDWERVASAMNATAEIIKQFTDTKVGSRKFLPRFKKAE